MKKLVRAKKTCVIFLALCVFACSFGLWTGLFLEETKTEVALGASYDSYYANLNESLTGTAFRAELADLITKTHHTETTYKGNTYKALANVFSESDADPDASGNILWFYSGTSVSFNGSFSGSTNREHVWPKDAGKAFPKESQAGSDAHHLRPCNNNLNSTRSSNSFGEVAKTSSNIVAENGSTSYANLCYQSGGVFYPGEGYRGATARILMYVQTRWGDDYGLSFVLGKGSCKTIGDIEDLMKWHIEEPPTEEEKVRNEVVYGIQGNRNPFIDHPEYAEMIYCYDGASYNDELQAVVDTYGSPDGGSTIEPTSISVSPSSVNLVDGQTTTLSAVVYPSGASQSVTWTTSNSSVATVNNGVVTATGSGTATITATSNDNSAIKASATVSVKGVTSITLDGTPTKQTYTEGETFNPIGVSVTATYSDGSTAIINNSDCSWLDGTTRASTLAYGTTSVICSYGGIEKTISGIIVKQGTTKTITITRDSFAGGNAYAWVGWTEGGIGGLGYIYPGKTDSIQMNNSKDSQYIYNTTALSGGIVSISIATTGEKSWNILTSTTPFSEQGQVASGGTNQGTLSSSDAGGTLTINTTDTYFAINYASTGVTYISEITIVYGTSVAHTPGEWIIDSEPTCTTSGIKHNECTECGEVIDVVETPATGHSYGSWTTTVEPTCEATGSEQRVCGGCGDVETRVVAKLDHNFGDWTNAENGMEQRVCEDCGEVEERAQANMEAVENFNDLVEILLNTTSLSEKLAKINDALEAYGDLTDSEKEEVAEAYSVLQGAIASYNESANEINAEADKATEQAILFYASTMSMLSVALYFILRV